MSHPEQEIVIPGRPARVDDLVSARAARTLIKMLEDHEWRYKVIYSRVRVTDAGGESGHVRDIIGIAARKGTRHAQASWSRKDGDKWVRGISWLSGVAVSALGEPAQAYVTHTNAVELKVWITDEQQWCETYLPTHEQDGGWQW